MEQNLEYVGLSGWSGDLANGTMLNNVLKNTQTPTTSSAPHWGTSVSSILGSLASAGMSTAQIITAIKGNQPVMITNPATGQTVNATQQLQAYQQQQGMSDSALLQFITNSNNDPKKEEKDNTLLYVGAGVVGLALVGFLVMGSK